MASKGKKAPVNEESSWAEFKRKFKANPFISIGTIVVLVIVVVAFVLVPAIVPNTGRSADLVFGVYDNVPIAYVPGNYFAQTYEMLNQYYRNMGGDNYNQYMDYQVWYEAYQRAAIRVATLQEMKRAQYLAPEKMVNREVAKLYQENGRFSPTLYKQRDSNARLAQWRQTQEDIALRHFYTDVLSTIRPAAEAEFIGKMASPRRSFDMTYFRIEDYPDSEIAAYGEEHSSLFRQVHLSMITINTGEREARKILNSIKDETNTFEDAARLQSQDEYAERGGDMGIKLAHELALEIPDEATCEKIVALKKGEYSDVIKHGKGWAFFRAEEDVQAPDFVDEASLGRVRSHIQDFERGRMEDWARAQADDFIALVDEKGFDAVIEQKGLTKRSFGPIPLNYGDVDLFDTLSAVSVSELYGAGSDETFWKNAFSTKVNTPSQPFSNGSYILVLYPTSEVEAEESSIESIQSTYSSSWLDYTNEQSLRTYFFNNGKMEDRFTETFMRYFMPSYN
ncbi:MAG: peptidylprolyl isomerase [Treponema sp.]|jgi:hypothetical protein|nr:peptidylprolyl isomerase [Treponema sp.]